ncbi:histidine kinase [Leifsonia sp. 1010]|uniref:sensor histidine kinase n=1 Tax=Leifsonia sp. 1010 TaxID=2817769 RepID=UPI00285B8AA5|nr:histidine kinase [Leifsonia sp. 1010]MDR6611947.1 signal transduction histidine kinase [Leifsonia sp. 1010]
MTAVLRHVRASEIVTAGATAVLSAVALAAAFAASSAGMLDSVDTVAIPALIVLAAAMTTQSALLILQRRWPMTILIAVSAIPVVVALVAPGPLFTISAVPVVVAVFRAGLLMPARGPLVLGAAASAAAVLAGHLIDTVATGEESLLLAVGAALGQAFVVVGGPLLVSLAIAGQRAARTSQQETVLALEREREALVGEALAQERTAMARELHDIAAHHLSAIALMASAIERQIETRPDAARESIRQVRSQSMAVLADLRRLVGLLRTQDQATDTVKTLETLPSLLDAPRAAGNPVHLEVLPRPSRLLGSGVGPLGQLAVYRMVQESLTNAVVHAASAASVVTIDDRDDRHLTVTVRTDPAVPTASPVARAGSSRGFGIVGMRERAELVGGTLEYGPTPDGGWETRMRVPRDRPDSDAVALGEEAV